MKHIQIQPKYFIQIVSHRILNLVSHRTSQLEYSANINAFDNELFSKTKSSSLYKCIALYCYPLYRTELK